MEYSKANQRRADRQRREKRASKELKDNNILKDIKKNPYLDDEYSYITSEDLKRVKKWRYMVGQDFTRPSLLADEEKEYYTKKYHIDKYEELPFCIIVPTFNNKPRKRAERNIRSILMQDYKNFHFIVIDDGSVDGTGNLIANYLATQKTVDPSRYKVEIHTDRFYSIFNIRNASRNFCKEEDILIVVDGDDELLGRQVLKLFNAVFQEKQVWYVYTNFLGSIGKVGYSRPYHPDIIQNNEYREYSFAVSHLRAYYNKLFLNVKDEDLQDENGKYFTSAGDMAIAIPCLEQAHTRVLYVPEMTYFYNFNTGLNVHKKRLNEQRQNNLKIRAKAKYEPLETLF
jgi:glycosyltransferase involved in cell wall biosynthesis